MSIIWTFSLLSYKMLGRVKPRSQNKFISSRREKKMDSGRKGVGSGKLRETPRSQTSQGEPGRKETRDVSPGPDYFR
jgi:hypothetical protein